MSKRKRPDSRWTPSCPALSRTAAGAGQMRKLNLTGSESLKLGLASPVPVIVSADHTRVEWFCLTGEPAKLCAEADWTPAKWAAAGERE